MRGSVLTYRDGEEAAMTLIQQHVRMARVRFEASCPDSDFTNGFSQRLRRIEALLADAADVMAVDPAA